MKNILLGIIIACFSATVLAKDGDWHITEVKSTDNVIVGYIYHSSSVGTQSGTETKKMVSSLRLVCTGKPPAQGKNDPLIVIFWNTMVGDKTQNIEIIFDKKINKYGTKYIWKQEGPLLIRSIIESKELIQSLKNNKTLYITWTDSRGIRRTTMFDLINFNFRFAEFNKLCNTDL